MPGPPARYCSILTDFTANLDHGTYDEKTDCELMDVLLT